MSSLETQVDGGRELSIPVELRAPVPRLIPESVQLGPLAQDGRRLRWVLICSGVACLVISFLPFIDALALYFLPLAYLSWLGLGLIALGLISHVFVGSLQKSTRYIEQGDVGVAEVKSLVLTPTAVYNGQPTMYAFIAGIEVNDPVNQLPRYLEVQSRPLTPHKRDRVDTKFRIGDKVPIVWLPGKFEKTAQIYDFLDLTLENSLERFDSPTKSWLSMIGVVLLVPLIFVVLFWNIYAFGRFLPIDFEFEDGVKTFVVGGVLGLGLSLVGWLTLRRQKLRIAERNEKSSMVGRAVEVEFVPSFFAKYGMSLIIIAGAILLGGLTFQCWCFTANALLDKSPAQASIVEVIAKVQETHSFLFRDYKLKYRWPGQADDYTLLTTPDHLGQFFLAPMGMAQVRDGWLGWKWVETIDPLIALPQGEEE